jgi:uncharacterized protein (TIGR02246 family)
MALLAIGRATLFGGHRQTHLASLFRLDEFAVTGGFATRNRSSRMMKRLPFCLSLLALLFGGALHGQQPDQAAEEAAIRKSAASYAEAFNKHDATALAALWSPDAVYTNRSTGEQVTGREAIAEQFSEQFKKQPDVKMELSVTSVEFLSPNVAIERGAAKVISPSEEPEEIEYSAVDVKRDGTWLLDRVTDQSKEVVPSHHEQLKPLEWMVGQWTTEAPGASVELDCNWTKNRNFLTRAFTLSIGDQDDFSGMQIIGWDAAAKAIRSWTFDSRGTFAEATWEQRDGRWFIRNRGLLPNGEAATMINVMRRVDDNSFTWQTIERTAGSEILPNIDEILIVRQ